MFFSSYVRLPVAVLVSLSLHLGIVALLAWGWEGKTETRKPPVQIVQAKLVQLEQTAPKQQAPKVTPKPQQQNVVDLTKKKRAEAEKAKQAALKKQREKEAKEKAERERKAAEKKKAEELKAQQAAEERKKKELAEELKQLEQQRVQNQLQQELAAAEAAEQAAFAKQQAEATAQSYVAVIAQRVEQFWSRPPSARKGMQCELLIQLVPTGRVVNVTVAKSSGNAAFDRSAEQAVLKAEQFKELRDVPSPVFEQYFRELRLVFNPQDLRL